MEGGRLIEVLLYTKIHKPDKISSFFQCDQKSKKTTEKKNVIYTNSRRKIIFHDPFTGYAFIKF